MAEQLILMRITNLIGVATPQTAWQGMVVVS